MSLSSVAPSTNAMPVDCAAVNGCPLTGGGLKSTARLIPPSGSFSSVIITFAIPHLLSPAWNPCRTLAMRRGSGHLASVFYFGSMAHNFSIALSIMT